jgi:hypothetical protein
MPVTVNSHGRQLVALLSFPAEALCIYLGHCDRDNAQN